MMINTGMVSKMFNKKMTILSQGFGKESVSLHFLINPFVNCNILYCKNDKNKQLSDYGIKSNLFMNNR
ncbi:hypothetical protein FPK15_contig00038-0021 [Flavobacterium psychrophilum]|nr:hypothetical protein FPK15_contig00038-0021 [Flavobacterium psychrophilum]GAW90048.1 hypothetical protein FPS14_contig00038-0024 [Flavobacterium psychrophilum]